MSPKATRHTQKSTADSFVLEDELKRHKKRLDPLVIKDAKTEKSRSSPYVFTTTGLTPISGWSRIKETIDENLSANKTKVTDWRTHDLRRTVSTNLGDLGFHDEDIAILLNHQSRGVTAIYNRSAYLDKKREMLEKWEKKLASVMK
jgi:integrase